MVADGQCNADVFIISHGLKIKLMTYAVNERQYIFIILQYLFYLINYVNR